MKLYHQKKYLFLLVSFLAQIIPSLTAMPRRRVSKTPPEIEMASSVAKDTPPKKRGIPQITQTLDLLFRKIDLSVEQKSPTFKFASEIARSRANDLKGILEEGGMEAQLLLLPLATLNKSVHELLSKRLILDAEDILILQEQFKQFGEKTKNLPITDPDLIKVTKDLSSAFSDGVLTSRLFPARSFKAWIKGKMRQAKESLKEKLLEAAKHKESTAAKTAATIVTGIGLYFTYRRKITQEREWWRDTKRAMKKDARWFADLLMGRKSVKDVLYDRKREVGSNITFNDVFGLEMAKEQLGNYIMHIKKGRYSHVPSMLFSGQPGLGKTMLAAAFAKEAQGMQFLSISGPKITQNWHLEDKFEEAVNRSPAVLFIDEIDRMDKKFQDQLQTYMEGAASDERSLVVVIGATNYPEKLDAALLSRFSIIDFKPLTPTNRQNILEFFLQTLVTDKKQLSLADELYKETTIKRDGNDVKVANLRKIAEADMNEFSPREISKAVKAAIGDALLRKDRNEDKGEIKVADLEKGAQSIGIPAARIIRKAKEKEEDEKALEKEALRGMAGRLSPAV